MGGGRLRTRPRAQQRIPTGLALSVHGVSTSNTVTEPLKKIPPSKMLAGACRRLFNKPIFPPQVRKTAMAAPARWQTHQPIRTFQNLAPFPGIERGCRVSKNALQWPVQQTDGVLLVFLEGGTGVGKSTLTWKLQKMGYSVYFEGFVELCKQNPHIPPTSAAMTLMWSSRLMSHMEHVMQQHQEGNVKDGIAFFDRSFLTPAVYARGLPVADFMMQVMTEVRESYSTLTVLCEAEEYAMLKQISGRMYDAAPPEKEVRTALGEEDSDFQREVLRRYGELEEEGHVDLIVDTSSSKLAIASLLHKLGIDFMAQNDGPDA